MLQIQLFDTDSLDVKLELPQFWDDFHLDELILIKKLLSQQIDTASFCMALLKYRIAYNKLTIPDWVIRIDLTDAVTELLPIAHYYIADNNLTRNPLPQLGKYYGPADGFDNMVCGEYEIADQLMNLFIETADVQYLLEMVYYLWRPLDEGGKRITLQDYEPSDAAKSFFRAYDMDKLQVIYLWWTGCRKSLTELFPLPFSGTNDANPADDEMNPSVFTDVIHSGAGERNGTRAHIRWNTLIKEFLHDIQLQLKHNQEMDDKYGT